MSTPVLTLREHLYEARCEASWAICHGDGTDAYSALRAVETHLDAMVAILDAALYDAQHRIVIYTQSRLVRDPEPTA